MTQPILNPVDLRLLLPLLPAEREFARCLAEGTLCTVGNGELPEEEIESGDNANVVRGEVVRFFAYGGDSDEHPIRGSVIGLRGARVVGKLNLTHADIRYALKFNYCRFVSSVVMRHAECVALYLSGAYLAQGLIADGLMVKGSVHLHKCFVAGGGVRLSGAHIGGDLSCEGGEFRNPKKNALSADRLTTKGDVFVRNGFFAEGEVSLQDANVGGSLSCADGTFDNLEGYALNAGRLTTKGDVFLSGGFSAKGGVSLPGANIGGHLFCQGGEFYNPTKSLVDLNDPKGYALIVESANINRALMWRGVRGEGCVHLGHTKTGVLADDSDSWKPFSVVLNGFAYDRFSGPVDAQSRLDWLGKRPQGMRFSPLPYEQAAKVLFGMGQAREAREILLEKERLQTADKRTPLLRKIGRRLWDVFAGYGYRLRRTAAWMAFFIYTGACVFLDADLQHRIVPHQSVVLADQKYQEAIAEGAKPTEFVPEMFSGYPEFNQFWLSVDIFIPLFNLHQETHWIPARDERGGVPWITLWYWIEIVAGWILTSLLLLSITGLLRPRQSSGEKG